MTTNPTRPRLPLTQPQTRALLKAARQILNDTKESWTVRELENLARAAAATNVALEAAEMRDRVNKQRLS